MLKTNKDKLVKLAVQGAVIFPRSWGWELSHKGETLFIPSVGGITYNVKVGDQALGWQGDHIEPGVSFTATTDSTKLNIDPNRSFNAFSCIGNEAVLISGKAKGKTGVVTGHHGGVEHVIVDFPDEVLKKMTLDDKILIHAWGQGLKFLDYPDIKVRSLDPDLVSLLKIKGLGEKIQVPVAAFIPAVLMGSGLGHNDVFKGDYDIQTSDPKTLKKYNLENLRFGDLVAILDHDSSYGWSYKKGAISIGVVVHGDSFIAGHGPGVQTILTNAKGKIKPVIDQKANLGIYLHLGRMRKKT